MPKRLRVALLPDFPGSLNNSIAVVIDTLRFTTTACHALSLSARQLTVVADIDGARSLADQASSRPLLCGERRCRPIPGFDLGNSPYEYTRDVVAEKDLIFSTTNGTRAVAAAHQAKEILLGGIVNRFAVAQAIVESEGKSVTIICSGTDGEVAGEDVLAAGAIIEAALSLDATLQLANDSAVLARCQWQPYASMPADERQVAIVNAFHQFSGGINLVTEGYQRDLEFAAQLDHIPVVPRSTPMTRDTFVATHAR